MKKHITKILILCSMLIVVGLCFCVLKSPNDTAYADITGVSGNNYVLVGYNGYQPDSYFVNADQGSTFNYATTKASPKDYLNAKGEQTNEHYVIVPKTPFNSRISSGYVDLYLTSDMREFAQNGVLYAKFNVGALSFDNRERSRVKFTLTYDGTSVSRTSSKKYNNESVYEPEYLESEYIKITDWTKPIRFSFETIAEATFLIPPDYMIFEPTIKIRTAVDSVSLDGAGEVVEVVPGQKITLNGTNDVVKSTSTSDFALLTKSIHKVTYDIISGRINIRAIVGDEIYLTSDVTGDGYIEIRAKCRKDSFSTEYIYSDIVRYKINKTPVNVKVKTDFKNPGKITGQGGYYIGQTVSLIASSYIGYTFNGWEMDGKLVSTSKNYSFTLTGEPNIKALYTKDVTISSVVVSNKFYDGTDVATIVDYVISGKEEGHDLSVTGVEAKYSQTGIGENIILELVKNKPVLVGNDAGIYNLVMKYVPTSVGNIRPRPVTVYADACSKQYGDSYENISFTMGTVDGESISGMVDGETIVGTLSRAPGETVGEYAINEGSIRRDNPNYEITFVGNTFTINPRDISIVSVNVANRPYNATTEASISVVFDNALAGDDVSVKATGEFESKDAGNRKVVNTEFYLDGLDKDQYKLVPFTDEIRGNIDKRNISVVAQGRTVVYGSHDDLIYTAYGLVDGETLVGSLSREDGEIVGTYPIRIGDLAESNPNYAINFTGADYKIIRKTITVTADALSKIYGDSDPVLTYSVDGLVGQDVLSGALERTRGDDCGEYDILSGLYNDNYEIEYISAIFTINPRPVSLNIYVVDKEYDGSALAEYSYEFTNTADELTFSATVVFVDENGVESAEVGENKNILLSDVVIGGEKIYNYDITNNASLVKASIKRRKVYVDVSEYEKIYGDEDQIIDYTYTYGHEDDDPELEAKLAEMLGNETLVGMPMRDNGENVGSYLIYLNDLNDDNNPNYTIINRTVGRLIIRQRNVSVAVRSQEKYYGDADPDVEYVISTELAAGEAFDDIYTGAVVRSAGEGAGRYDYSIGTLAVNQNYKLNFVETGYLRIKKRPVTVTAHSMSKIYGDDDEELAYDVVNTIDNVPLMNFGLTRVRGEDVGDYTISYTTLDDPHYDITYVGGVYKITPRALVIKADNKFKVYGGVDPKFTCTIVEGILVNNDYIYNIETGSMIREAGENVGEYDISMGTYTLGDNYSITYVPGTLTILKQALDIEAVANEKYYGDDDPYLAYIVRSGSLKFGDSFSGGLTRQEGEQVGAYTIQIGTLNVNDNYDITFTTANFNITKRPITIIADRIVKTYGDDEPELTYTILGTIVNDDQLDGALEREKPTSASNPKLYENVGTYAIMSTLNNDSYEITYVPSDFVIEQRVIKIAANSKEVIYGSDEAELDYEITDGDILDGDVLSGSLYRVPGDNVGLYDIRSSLTLGKNYKIVFTKGTYTIKPIELKAQTNNYEKIYGSLDPEFEYEIVEGELINGDVLAGAITREEGNNVGSYKLISTLNNINYTVTLADAYLTIRQKDAFLECGVQDKVYNGDNVAYIKTPMVRGLIDNDITLSYDKENCAYFVSSDPAEGIGVVLHDIVLKGTNADNYNLIYPENLAGNITLNTVSTQNVALTTSSNTSLVVGTELKANKTKVRTADMGISNKQIISSYDVWLENDGEETDLSGTITLQIDISKKYTKRNNIYVYRANEDGTYTLVGSTVVGNTVLINTDELGTYVVVADNELWIDIGAYISIGILVLLVAYFVWRAVKKRKAKRV